MAIRKSAAGAIHQLIADLADPDPAARETAAARLSVIGERAVAHLVDAFRNTPSAVARAEMLRILASTRDRRGLTLALEVLATGTADPGVAAAAIQVLSRFVDDESAEALDALGAIVLDEARPEAERLAAWAALAGVPPRVLAPIRQRLTTDGSETLRAVALADVPPSSTAAPPLTALVDAALSGRPVDPATLAAAFDCATDEIPVPALHQLVEELGVRERVAPGEADRLEWVNARAAVHDALAARGSRVAVYDVRETIAASAGSLPNGFLAAAAQVGDAACLESIAEALARMPAIIDRTEHAWRDRLIAAGRAIVAREKITRRQAVGQRLARKHPEIARVLFARQQ